MSVQVRQIAVCLVQHNYTNAQVAHIMDKLTLRMPPLLHNKLSYVYLNGYLYLASYSPTALEIAETFLALEEENKKLIPHEIFEKYEKTAAELIAQDAEFFKGTKPAKKAYFGSKL